MLNPFHLSGFVYTSTGTSTRNRSGPLKTSLVPIPSRKAEKGSGVLNDFSSHMGRGRMA